jgi:hypothetical protein
LPQANLVQIKSSNVSGLQVNTDYAAGSGTLVVLNRHQGNILWSRPAAYSFRHNAIAIGAGKLFCLDKLTDKKISYLKRRGWQSDEQPTIYALDAQSGNVLWTHQQNVFGTWLAYSKEYDILVEAGSHSRDRAGDEPKKGLAAYRGANGDLLWRIEDKYEGPVMLHHQTIITQSGAFDLLSGKRRQRQHPFTGESVPWQYARNYGCNTAIASEYLLTFRSAAAGFFDLQNDGGTGNFGGVRSGCTSSLIAADGVLNAPDYTHTCTCSYQNQTSVAFIHMPDAEIWTFNKIENHDGPIKQVGINFGAPGDRKTENGTLWLEYPVVGGTSPKLSLTIEDNLPNKKKDSKGRILFAGSNFRHHPSRIQDGPLPWVASSGLENLSRIVLTLGKDEEWPRPYTVRLVFAEMDEAKAESRVFNVALQGRDVLRDFNVAQAAGGTHRSVIKEFRGVQAKDTLEIQLTATSSRASGPLLCGVEILAE